MDSPDHDSALATVEKTATEPAGFEPFTGRLAGKPTERRSYKVPALGIACLWAAIAVLVLSPGPLAALTGRDRDHYAFIGVQPGSGEPVTWDHCRAIPYHVNPTYAPPNWRELVQAAFADISAASGFVFVDRGTTSKRTLSGSYNPETGTAEPVLVMWSNSGRLHDLEGDTIGMGGSGAVRVGSRLRFVTGRVAMDSNLHTDVPAAGFTEQRIVLEHEIGHVLGLDHVDDPHQVMNGGYVGQTRLGRGDIAGLKALHAVPCGG